MKKPIALWVFAYTSGILIGQPGRDWPYWLGCLFCAVCGSLLYQIHDDRKRATR